MWPFLPTVRYWYRGWFCVSSWMQTNKPTSLGRWGLTADEWAAHEQTHTVRHVYDHCGLECRAKKTYTKEANQL